MAKHAVISLYAQSRADCGCLTSHAGAERSLHSRCSALTRQTYDFIVFSY